MLLGFLLRRLFSVVVANDSVSTNLRSLVTLAHFCSICLGNVSVHPPPSLRFNVAYRDEFVISRFHHCRGGGVPIPVMSSLIVSKIACQCIFMPSYPGVPRLLSCIVGVLWHFLHHHQGICIWRGYSWTSIIERIFSLVSTMPLCMQIGKCIKTIILLFSPLFPLQHMEPTHLFVNIRHLHILIFCNLKPETKE